MSKKKITVRNLVSRMMDALSEDDDFQGLELPDGYLDKDIDSFAIVLRDGRVFTVRVEEF